MKKILALTISSFLAFSTFSVEAKSFNPLKPAIKKASSIKNEEHYFTSNGIEVILKKVKTSDVTGVKVFIKGGSRNINEKNAGIEKLLLSTMLQGSKEFPKDKLNMETSKMGIQIGADSFFDYSALSLKTLDKYFDKALYIFQSLINTPLLDNKDFELEKEHTLAEIKSNIDDPDEYVWKVLNNTFSAGHPYYNDFGGTVETIPNINQASLKNYLKDNFVGSKLLIVVVGNYKDSIKKDLEKYFGKLPKGSYKDTPVPPLNVTKPEVTVEDRDIPTSYIVGRFTVPSIKDADYPATYLGLRILSEKFHETVRTKHGLSYAVSAGSSLREANSGYLYVTTVKPKESIELMYQEIEKMQTNPIDKKYLEGVINLYYTQYFLNMESNFQQAGVLGSTQIISKDYTNSYKLLDKFKKVTPEDIKVAMKKHIKNIHFAIIAKKDLIDTSLFFKK